MGLQLSLALDEATRNEQRFSLRDFNGFVVGDFHRALDSLQGWKGSSISISNGDLTAIPSLQGLEFLETLVVEGTKLSVMHASVLACVAASLKELVLRRNYFCGSTFPLQGPESLPPLTSLCLAENLLAAFPLDVAQQLTPTLSSLDLEKNSLTDCESICVLTQLRMLKLSHNRLKAIPEAISCLTNLQSVYLQHNLIYSVPPTLASLLKLRNLYLNDNHLGAIPPELSALSSLRNLGLQHNVLREIPDNLFVNMGSLQMLALNDNVLFTVPSSIGCLTQLNRLFLHENALCFLPEKIGRCGELSTLRVEYNELRALPDSLTSCRSLIVLIAHNNKLMRVPPCCGEMPQLIKLSLEFNPLNQSQASTLQLQTAREKTPQLDLESSDVKSSEDFCRAFEHFVVSRDLSPSRGQNFLQGPGQAKMLLMRQHRDAELRMFLDGRMDASPANDPEANVAHAMDPETLVSILANDPSESNLNRILAGLAEFQDSWFALFMEFGGFEELLRLLHHLFVERERRSESVGVIHCALRTFQVIFDAAWKTVLATNSSVTLLLLHLDSPSRDVTRLVLQIALDIARIPEIGAQILLKGFSQRKKIIVTPEPRLYPLYRCADETSTPVLRALVLRIVNIVLEGLPVAERAPIRVEFMALHPVSSKDFLQMLDTYSETDSELNTELDIFLAQLKEDASLLAVQREETKKLASGAEDTAKFVQVRARGPIGLTTRNLNVAMNDDSAIVLVTAAPLVGLSRKDRQIKVPVRLKAPVKLLVEEVIHGFGAAPNFDYGLYFLSGTEKQVSWIDEQEALVNNAALVNDQGKISSIIYFSIKPVNMTVRLPSGETRSFPIVLAELTETVIQELSKHIEGAGKELVLAQTTEANQLKANTSLASQGVEPYTLLLLLHVADHLVSEKEPAESRTPVVASSIATQETTAKSRALVKEGPSSDSNQVEADEPLGNIWDEPLTARYLIIENGEVTSATLNKMIERMTSTETLDLQLTQTFMIAHKSFTTAEELWGKLQERYHAPSRVPEGDRQKVRVRVCMFVKKWLEGTRRGDVPASVLASLKQFAEIQLVTDGLLDMQGVILKVLAGEKHDLVIQFDRARCPKVKHPKVKQLDKMTLMDIDVVELARQVTIVTWELFCKIEPHEFFEQAWMKKNCQELAPNLLQFIAFFNHFSNGLALQIVSEPRFRKRAQRCERLIDVGMEIRKLNNFHLVMALISTFAQASINRLKFTFEKISEGHKVKLKELQDLMNPTKSFQAYRLAYKECAIGIPYMGASLTDLLFISEATLSKVGPRINVQKHTSVCVVLEKLQMLKRRLPLNLEPEESIQKWIADMPEVSEKELYACSLALEPRGASQDDIK